MAKSKRISINKFSPTVNSDVLGLISLTKTMDSSSYWFLIMTEIFKSLIRYKMKIKYWKKTQALINVQLPLVSKQTSSWLKYLQRLKPLDVRYLIKITQYRFK